MTFVMPAVNNQHRVDPDLNARRLANIGTIQNVQVKPNGNLPLANDAGQFRNNQAPGGVGGIGYEFQASQAAWDVSTDTRLMLWHCQQNAPNRIQVGSISQGGHRIRIYSGTGSMPTDYLEFHVGGNDSPACASISGQFPYVVDLNDRTEDLENGTFDNTDVTSYAFVTETQDMAGTNDSWSYMGEMYVITTTKSSADTPTFSGSGAEPEDAVTLIQGSDYTDKLGNWVRQSGSVIFIDMPFRIGNNSTITTFNDNGLTIVSPVANDSSDPRVRITTQAMRTYLNLRNNVADTATFSGTWIWQTRAPFDWDQDDSAVVTFSSPTFRGMGDFTVGSSITGPATFDDVYPVITADTGVDLDGSTFKNQALGYGLELTAGAMDIADMRFETYAANSAVTSIDGTTDVDDVNEELDLTGHGFDDGEQVLYEDGADATPITGLSDNTMYWAHVIDANTISLHNSRADALSDTSRVGLTDTASSTTNSLTPQKHAILIDTAGTYNFDNVFFDQSGTNDIETTHATGTVTINISNGGTVPTVTETGAGAVVVNNNVTVSVTVTDTSGTAIENARVRMIADETVGTITTGDVILTGLTNASGVIETTTFNYEAAFDPSGLDVITDVRQGTVSPYKKPVEDKADTITSAGLTFTVALIDDE